MSAKPTAARFTREQVYGSALEAIRWVVRNLRRVELPLFHLHGIKRREAKGTSRPIHRVPTVRAIRAGPLSHRRSEPYAVNRRRAVTPPIEAKSMRCDADRRPDPAPIYSHRADARGRNWLWDRRDPFRRSYEVSPAPRVMQQRSKLEVRVCVQIPPREPRQSGAHKCIPARRRIQNP